jgi:uncharacterized protein
MRRTDTYGAREWSRPRTQSTCSDAPAPQTRDSCLTSDTVLADTSKRRRGFGREEHIAQIHVGYLLFVPSDMPESLPWFLYHPDPVGTGSIVASPATCRRCGSARGYIYAGPVYAEGDLDEAICPWCIADGSAAREFDATFTDADSIGDYGSWDEVPAEVVDEVSKRTPGFNGWQQERWWTHCGDAAAFLGRAGGGDVAKKWPEAIPALMEESGIEGDEWDEYLVSLDADGSPTAYIFKCRKCGQLGGYSDSD